MEVGPDEVIAEHVPDEAPRSHRAGSLAASWHSVAAPGDAAGAPYTPDVDRRSRLVLLTVLGAGVFLAGLELMVTAVALPSIVVDLASWTELREASWIINGYLLAYVITMPLAGRLADQWGVRRLFHAGLITFTLGLAPGRAGPVARDPHRRPARPGDRRRDPRAGRDGGRLAPLRRRRAAPGARRHRGADLPGHGRRAVRRGLDHRRDPSRRRARRGRHRRRSRPDRPRGPVALRLLRQRPDRRSRPSAWPGRPPTAGRRRAARAPWTCPARSPSRSPSASPSSP